VDGPGIEELAGVRGRGGDEEEKQRQGGRAGRGFWWLIPAENRLYTHIPGAQAVRQRSGYKPGDSPWPDLDPRDDTRLGCTVHQAGDGEKDSEGPCECGEGRQGGSAEGPPPLERQKEACGEQEVEPLGVGQRQCEGGGEGQEQRLGQAQTLCTPEQPLLVQVHRGCISMRPTRQTSC
jgi:hypothetical protein